MIESPPSPQTRGGGPLRFALFAVTAIFVVTGVVLRVTAPDPEALPPSEPRALELRTHTLRAEPLVLHTEIASLLEPLRSVELFAEVGGRVIEVGARELDRVEADQLLFRMDPVLAEVAIERAKAAIERAQSERRFAIANLERNQGLADVNVASRAALDETENASQLAKAAIRASRAELTEAEHNLAQKTVVAPFSGILRTFPIHVGEYVQPGERIAELLDVDRLRITIGLTDRQIVAVEPGARAHIRVDALPGELFEGEIVRVGQAIDLSTRKFPIRIEVDNTAGNLFPGMVTSVSLELVAERLAMTIPLDAVIEELGLAYVFVVETDADGSHHVERRRVEIGQIPFQPTRVEVQAGVAEGERIATSSVRQLRDGMVVQPLPDGARVPLAAGEGIR